jgi:hypothetical protein
MEPREQLQAALAVIEAHARSAHKRQQDLEALASDSDARLQQALSRYQAILPALGAGKNRAIERDYVNRLGDRRSMTLAPMEHETPGQEG